MPCEEAAPANGDVGSMARARRKLWRGMARAPADGDLGLMGAREEARRRRGLAGRIHRGEVIACGRNRWNR